MARDSATNDSQQDSEMENSCLQPFFYGLHTLTGSEESFLARLESICCDGLHAERQAKASRPSDEPVWAYGEVVACPFVSMLRDQREETALVSPSEECGFVDLGSGAGRAVLAAALLGDFSWCRGIEALDSLHREAEEALACCLEDANMSALMSQVRLQCADLTQVPWWEGASVVFCNCITWPDQLIAALGDGAVHLRFGSRLLLVGRQLPRTTCFTVSKTTCDMSWAAAVPIWIYKRRHDHLITHR
eukprot:TRINITY_DN52539_c0_g1_i1.p1 TRINITY_DN52539_c0_g1~~TRINITY_DN52539_c0_g1_i1.p1  ORF type:complete len:269 (-),score=30.03 TRINITY_DN52539_c0_g1_i1:12-752(-)